MLLLQLSTLTFSADSSSCVNNYLDFEEQTFGNNSENRLKLYEAFYPPNDHLPYSVVVTYQAVLPNGTRVNISTDPTCPDRQVWLWLSSPILLLVEPTRLNRVVLFTLNYFTEWVPPHLIITTPPPCSTKAEGFLMLMTSSVSAAENSLLIVVSKCQKMYYNVCSLFCSMYPSFRHMLWERCQRENTWDIHNLGASLT